MSELDDFLNREADYEGLEGLVNTWGDLIDEIVSYGVEVFQWCNQAGSKLPKDAPLPLLLLLRHVLEMLDAISILTRTRCAEPIKLNLRSLLEALLYIEYILEDKGQWERRALSYILATKRTHHQQLQKFDPNTAQGKQFLEAVEKDKMASGYKLPELPKGFSEPSSLFSSEYYKDVEAEWQRMKEERKKQGRTAHISWYSLFGGPKSLKELADKVRLTLLYETLYRFDSDYAHGGAILSYFRSKGDQPAFVSLRHPRNLQNFVATSITLALRVYRIMLGFFDAEKLRMLEQWYIARIRNRHLDIAQNPKIIIQD